MNMPLWVTDLTPEKLQAQNHAIKYNYQETMTKMTDLFHFNKNGTIFISSEMSTNLEFTIFQKHNDDIGVELRRWNVW